MKESSCLHTSPLQVVASKHLEQKATETFSDNLAHIEFLVAEVQLWVALAYLRLKNIKQFSIQDTALSFLNIPSGVNNINALEQCIAAMAARRQNMEKAANKKNVSLKFYELALEYGLDDFEIKVLQILFVADSSLEFRAIFDQCDVEFWNNGFRSRELEIGVILSILCKDYQEQFSCRSCFSINRPLVKYEIIKLSGRGCGLLETEVELHERISLFCLDDHNVYDTELLCISSENPVVKFSQVILDKDLKQDLLCYVESFIDNSKNSQEIGKAFGYGTGLTCLFYGLSGTGKTMLAHAIANHMGCKLYSVNVGGLEHEEISFEDAIKHIFREAKLSNGIVFLDECDDLLTDSSNMSRTFLIEVEKAECITILATNKTLEMDPALDRRISLKIPFGLPEEKERLSIWKALLPEGMEYGDDVDLVELAVRYQFTGGLIKNTLLMAARRAMVKNESGNSGKIIIDAAEIHKAGLHQAKSMFDLGSVGKLIMPQVKLADLPIRRIDKDRLQSVVNIIPEIKRIKQGFCGLICAKDVQSGVESVNAVAAETGMMLRQFSLPKLFSGGNPYPQDMGKILDPFTQQPISLLEYVFVPRPGQQEILVLVDDSCILEKILKNSNESMELQDWQRFRNLIRDFQGILFVVSTPIAENLVPIEFACHLSLLYPVEEVQIQAWLSHFPDVPEGEIVDLVERFPMYIPEIDLVSRQAAITARMEGIAQAGITEIIAMARRLRGVQHMPVLFGG